MNFPFANAGTYDVVLNVSDAVGLWDTDGFQVTVRDTTYPVAVAGEEMTVGLMEEVTFDGTASSDNVAIISWSWTLTEGSSTVTLIGPTAVHAFDDIGTHTVTLTVGDSSGLSTTDEVRVHVLDTVPPVAVVSPPVQILEGERASFSGANSSDNVDIRSYIWSFVYNQALKEIKGAQASHLFELKGNYTVTLTVTDTSGNTATATTWVEVLGPDDGDDNGVTISTDTGWLLYVGIALIVLCVIIVSAVVLRRRKAKEDFGWSPSDEERNAKTEGDGDDDWSDEDEDPGEGDKEPAGSQDEAEIEPVDGGSPSGEQQGKG